MYSLHRHTKEDSKVLRTKGTEWLIPTSITVSNLVSCVTTEPSTKWSYDISISPALANPKVALLSNLHVKIVLG